MGKVFEFAEIVHGDVPQPDDFRQAKTLVLNQLSKFVKIGDLYGAKIFGSVANDCPNERSDFDLVVITENNHVLPQLAEIFAYIKRKTCVDIEPIIVSKDFAQRGLHTIEDLFLEHIRQIPQEGNLIGNNPSKVLKSPGLSPAIDHKHYLAEKLRRFGHGMFTTDTLEKNKVLQRALEAPINIGRRTLQVITELGYPGETLKNDQKQTVIKQFRESFKKTSLVKGFNFLLEQDLSYTVLMRETLAGKIREQQYYDKLNIISQDTLPEALNWTHSLTAFYLSLLENQ